MKSVLHVLFVAKEIGDSHFPAQRKVDSTLLVPSPISGRIITRNAAPGSLTQPGNAPAPYSVADLSTMWMIANVIETDAPAEIVFTDHRRFGLMLLIDTAALETHPLFYGLGPEPLSRAFTAKFRLED